MSHNNKKPTDKHSVEKKATGKDVISNPSNPSVVGNTRNNMSHNEKKATGKEVISKHLVEKKATGKEVISNPSNPSVVGNTRNSNSNNILNSNNIDGGNESRITFDRNSGKSSDSSTKIKPPVADNNPKNNSVAGNWNNTNSNNIMNSNNERGGNKSPISF